MIEILDKDFNTRAALELHISSMTGLTVDPKPEYVIHGTRNELRRLFLSHGSLFWGIRCEDTTPQEPAPKAAAPDRGKRHKSKVKTMDINNSEEI